MNAQTKKILVIAGILIVALNMIEEESQKSFEQKVLDIVNKNPSPAAVVPPPAPDAPPAPAGETDEFKKALAEKVNVDIGNTPIRGNRFAKIMLVVFSDFQCPFSKRGADTAMALIQKYGNDINFVHKNLPLGFHPEALPAAKAALAAGKQGKFYEYHDKIYEGQGQIGEALYVQIAKDLGLNLVKFNADRNSKEIADQVQADADQASKLGFNGTPGFTLNGVKILGAYPQDHFEKIIKALGLE